MLIQSSFTNILPNSLACIIDKSLSSNDIWQLKERKQQDLKSSGERYACHQSNEGIKARISIQSQCVIFDSKCNHSFTVQTILCSKISNY